MTKQTQSGVVLNVKCEECGGERRGCVMERVLCYLIICCPEAEHKDAEIFRGKQG